MDQRSSAGSVAERPPRLPDGFRILHVLDHSLPTHSGYSFRTISLLREQRRRGWYTAHLTTPKHTNPGPAYEEIDAFAFYRTPPVPPLLSRVPVVNELALIRATAKRIVEVAAIERPHVLHAHSPVLNALACLLAARTLRLPVVYEVRGFWEDAAVSHGTATEDGPRYRATRALETFALQRCDAVTAICQGLRQEMLKRGIADERITLIPNGVDIEEFPFGTPPDPKLRASLGLDGKVVLGFLGSYYAYEGLDLLLDALPGLLEKQSNVVALLVGGGPEENALKQQAQRLRLGDAVRFIGRVPHERIQDYYNLVTVFVYPRHRMRLTESVTPLKPLEAMAHGGIVLASDVGGHRELVRARDTGYLFRADDREDLTRTLLHLIANQQDWEPMRQRARKFVEQERSWAATTAGYPAAYARAMSAKH
ncbi:MAG TPA: TIGR04063 family PEP-CTERM/XrtA system glycosyltransferase [Stellaceae bacterium]|nr:TIGR04063 family PEP-CTERM/XrtA system glycosyltransferase [Stellaceae bacterium]